MTAFADVDRAVEAMRAGACDFLLKPFEPKALLEHVARYRLPEAMDDDRVIASDQASRNLFALATRVAQTDTTVLLTGESGVGKEVVARYIHNHSARRAGLCRQLRRQPAGDKSPAAPGWCGCSRATTQRHLARPEVQSYRSAPRLSMRRGNLIASNMAAVVVHRFRPGCFCMGFKPLAGNRKRQRTAAPVGLHLKISHDKSLTFILIKVFRPSAIMRISKFFLF